MKTKTTFQLSQIPNGKAGTVETLKRMAKLVKQYKKHPTIMLLARKLVQHLPQKSFRKEGSAIHKFVRDRVRYVKDIYGVETLQSPVKTLEIGQGDCDDKSMLTAALLLAIGHPARFVVVGNEPDRFCHVYVETKIKNQWIPVETTEPWEFGEVRRKSKIKGVFHIK